MLKRLLWATWIPDDAHHACQDEFLTFLVFSYCAYMYFLYDVGSISCVLLVFHCILYAHHSSPFWPCLTRQGLLLCWEATTAPAVASIESCEDPSPVTFFDSCHHVSPIFRATKTDPSNRPTCAPQLPQLAGARALTNSALNNSVRFLDVLSRNFTSRFNQAVGLFAPHSHTDSFPFGCGFQCVRIVAAR